MSDWTNGSSRREARTRKIDLWGWLTGILRLRMGAVIYLEIGNLLWEKDPRY